MVKKRRTGGGRVTPSKKDLAEARVTAHDPVSSPTSSRPVRTGPSEERESAVAPSGRYTPRKPTFRRRPRWHRFAGWAGIALGVLIAVVNDAMLFTEDTTLLPFGHQEFYLMLAFVVAGGSTWFLGLFDRGTTVFD